MNQTIPVFGYPETLVKEYNYWVVMVRPHQITLGTLVIASKSDATKLGDLAADEWAEFAIVAEESESLLIKTFGAEKFNYCAFMMKDPNPHFHLVPRYSKSVNFNDRDWVDDKWPDATDLKRVEVTEAETKAILVVLKSQLS